MKVQEREKFRMKIQAKESHGGAMGHGGQTTQEAEILRNHKKTFIICEEYWWVCFIRSLAGCINRNKPNQILASLGHSILPENYFKDKT